MDSDEAEIEEMVLALLYLTTFTMATRSGPGSHTTGLRGTPCEALPRRQTQNVPTGLCKCKAAAEHEEQVRICEQVIKDVEIAIYGEQKSAF